MYYLVPAAQLEIKRKNVLDQPGPLRNSSEPGYKPIERNIAVKRSLTFTATLVLFVLALVFSSPYSARTVKADQPDPCVKCQAKVQRDFEHCEARYGVSQFCYDQFNQGIINCYATVCEQ
jgi:hypothetical protein